ncbi:MAG: NUMOD4 domain-containing protein [Bacillota bacterium]
MGELNYEVSNLGRVRNSATGYILNPSIYDNKYYRVTLTHPDKSRRH